jgi:SAM-dependent methyltransferase
MPNIASRDTSGIIDRNISYHDGAAATYNRVMDEDRSNIPVRLKVKEKLLSLLPSGYVLDFGGGTGLDLEWLTARGYNVLFCEPSVTMREKAMEYNNLVLHSDKITFLESSGTDFTTWGEVLPFPRKVDAILSNFGPLNYIPDMERLFGSLALVIKPGGHFVLLVLDFDFKKRFRWHRRNAVRSLLFNTPFVMYIPYEDGRQTIFVHTVKEIRVNSGRYFDYCSHESLPGFGFMIIHLVRNEKID